MFGGMTRVQLRERCVYLGLLLLLVFSYPTGACAAGREKAEEQGRSLLKAAAERSLFHADKSAPFGLLFKFELRSFGAKPAPGAYSWLVTSQGDWREETKFLDYSDLEINRGTTLWIKRNSDYRPLQSG